MPAGMVRPRASQVDPLRGTAIAAYRAAGWRLSEHGRVDAGTVTGPCARCRKTTTVYGPHGNPLCPTCHQTLPKETSTP